MGNTIRVTIAFIPSKKCQKFLIGNLEEMPLDKMVDVSGSQLRRFPLQICSFTRLVKLYLSDNKLRNLPQELKQLQSLQILALDFNGFRELPIVVCSLKQLSILYLGNNRLHALPSELSLLKELKILWIETNYFSDFPDVICELRSLKTLHVGYNQLRCLPKGLNRLEDLSSVWLSGNLFSEFPEVLLEMHFLDVIRRFPSLAHLKGLKLVIYDHNPCVNAPAVAEGVRRWATNTEEIKENNKQRAGKPLTETKEPQIESQIKPDQDATF
ncbi:Leucine-rich repeat-containing protein 10 [Acipenser ruthenus]|uniref:Leucine-rich repeat-containing protein 10 n=1 Tax=Acipenser ruthenus TaxID=7906 RepID=A0A444V244_ACIRT|nr:Leucine-rich repeat-containing protein 10 [Acipenser ruthenus]